MAEEACDSRKKGTFTNDEVEVYVSHRPHTVLSEMGCEPS